MRRVLIIIFSSLLLLINSLADAAEPKNYQVELIVFSTLTSDALNSEQWPQFVPNDRQDGYAALDASAGSYALSPDDRFIMNRESSAIQSSNQYTILLHQAWIIPRQTLLSGTALHLYGGHAYDDSGNLIATVTDESTPYPTAQQWELNGTLNINIKRYFNLLFNLNLAEPNSIIEQLAGTNIADPSAPFLYFKLKQSRRMRSKELNYIGHPLLGVLVKIMPHIDIDHDEQQTT
jgi:hypothetical protein